MSNPRADEFEAILRKFETELRRSAFFSPPVTVPPIIKVEPFDTRLEELQKWISEIGAAVDGHEDRLDDIEAEPLDALHIALHRGLDARLKACEQAVSEGHERRITELELRLQQHLVEAAKFKAEQAVTKIPRAYHWQNP